MKRFAVWILVVGLVGGASWVAHDELAPRTVIRLSDVETQLASEVPPGSGESDAFAFLSRHHYAMDQTVEPVTNSDGFLRAHGVALGTLNLYGRAYPSRLNGLFEENSGIDIWITFDAQGRVDHTYAIEQ